MSLKWLLGVLLLFTSISLQAQELPDSYFDDGYDFAVNKWLQIDAQQGQQISSVYESTFYKNGFAIELAYLLEKNKWQVYKRLNYDYNLDTFTAVVVDMVQVGQAPKKEVELCVSCTYFVAKKDDPNSTLIVSLYDGQSVNVMHRSSGDELGNDKPMDGSSLELAQEFLTDIRTELNKGSVYKNGVLEFNGYIQFLAGVDDIKSTWEDFIFPQVAKNKIIESIDGFINEYDEQKWSTFDLPLSRGVLLYGPPGTGKSFIARILASNILNKRYKNKISYIHISARHMSGVDTVRTVYQVARALSPSVVFIEDIDLIAGTDRTDRADIKNELMQQLSGIETLKGVLTVGTTNVAELIDPALTRSMRLGYQFEIGLPRLDERLNLFKIYFGKSETSKLDIMSLANQTESYSGADIKDLCDIAIENAINAGSFVDGTEIALVLPEHLEDAFRIKKENKVKNGGLK